MTAQCRSLHTLPLRRWLSSRLLACVLGVIGLAPIRAWPDDIGALIDEGGRGGGAASTRATPSTPSRGGGSLERVRIAVALGSSVTLSADNAIDVQATTGGTRKSARTINVSLRRGVIDAAGVRASAVHLVSESAFIKAGKLKLPGELTLVADKEILAVLDLSIETYLIGVVSKEMSPSWPTQALAAQAVLARTYAAHHAHNNRGKPYDLYADTRSQAYLWQTARDPHVVEAIGMTSGWVLQHNGEPIQAFFHACSGGSTVSTAEVWGKALPYVVPVADPEGATIKACQWRSTIDGKTLGRALGVGTARGVTIARRSASGRATKIEVRGSSRTKTISGDDLRAAVGYTKLKSTLFDVSRDDGAFVFVGKGSGHGVGLSQWTTKILAEKGWAWQEILDRYYPNADLVPLND